MTIHAVPHPLPVAAPRAQLRRLRPLLTLVLCAATLVAAAAEDDSGDDAASIAATRSGLAYGEDPRQVIDLWLPAAGAQRPPLVVWVHGGAWRMGDRRHVGAKPAWALAAGWAFASVEYRLTPQVRHPAHAEDVATAVAHLAARGNELGFDGSRIALLGHSAGAHLVAVVATDAALRQRCRLGDGIVRAVIGLDGAGYDIARTVAAGPARARRLYADAFGDDAAAWTAASPAHLVAVGGTYPPMFLPYVGRRATSGAVAEDLAARLRAVGGEATTLAVPDSSHALINRRFGTADDAVTVAAAELLRRVFAAPPTP